MLVTPNILHGDLARMTLDQLPGPVSASSSLVLWKARKPFRMPWTEYSLYTSTAEISGTLYDYHAEWDTCYTSDVAVL